MSDQKPQMMKFIQACPPALDDGEYHISIKQSINISSSQTETLEKEQYFSIKGPRFKLKNEIVNSVFPPENQKTSYGNALPHIVINRKTLPWERNIFGSKVLRQEVNGGPLEVTPWVCLLTFSKSEAPECVKNTAKAIILPEEGIITGDMALDNHLGESESSPCMTIDIPIKMFKELMPTLKELSYLSHGRYVETDTKHGSNNLEGYYSVVIGNRFPLASEIGEKNTTHLVSLEGLGEYLSGGMTDTNDASTKVRLISLYSWSYTIQTSPYNFKKLVDNLNPASVLKMPTDIKQTQVKNAFEMGYVPLNHELRNGEKTVSWYRGPLVPLALSNKEIEPKFCSDTSLNYDPEIGMFDVSYASAWQIGRMLALQNKSFATTLFQWRRENNQGAAHDAMKAVLDSKQIGMTKEELSKGEDTDKMLSHHLTKHIHQILKEEVIESEKKERKVFDFGDPSNLSKVGKNIPGLLEKETLNKLINEEKEIKKTGSREQLIHKIIETVKGAD